MSRKKMTTIFRASTTTRRGKKIYASDYGYRGFPIKIATSKLRRK